MKLNLLEIMMSEIPSKEEEKEGGRFAFLNKNLASTRQINNGSSAFLDGNKLFAIMAAKNHPGKFYVRFRYENRAHSNGDKDPYKVIALVDSYTEAIQTIKNYINKKEKNNIKKDDQKEKRAEYLKDITKQIENLNNHKLQKIVDFIKSVR
jgi:hypothetical protein